MIKKIGAIVIALAVIWTPLPATASEEELKQQIEELQKTMQQLESEVRQLREERPAAEAGRTDDEKEKIVYEKAEAAGVKVDTKWTFLENIYLGADYRIRGAIREKGKDDDPDKDNYEAYDQRLRVMFDYIDDSGVALKTRVLLYDNNWLGDRRASGGAGSDIGDGSDNISLDYGFLEIPFKETWNFRIGRQVANWAWNFVTDDDRRDRMLLTKSLGLTSVGNMTVLAIYDKRQEGLADVEKDDGDMVAVATVTQTGNWTWGLLLDYWHGWADYVSPDPEGVNGYVLDDLWSLSPTLQGTFGDGFELRWALHYMNGNGRGDGKYEPGQGYWANTSWSTFAVLGYNFDFMKAEVQGYLNQNGALVGTGWDTFSSVISNSPRNDPNPIALSKVGGLGYDGDNQWLAAGRLSGKLFDQKVGWSLAGGYVDTRNNDPDPVNNGLDNLYDLEAPFADVQASWTFFKTLELVGKFGYIFGDEEDDGPGAGRYGTSIHLSWNY